jgi:hypothetical protein
MTEVQKKETGKGTLIAVAVVAIVLAVSNVGIYVSLNGQITDLTSQKNSLQGQVNTLTTDKANLQSQLSSLNTTYQNYELGHLHANSQYDALNTAYQGYIANHTHSDTEYQNYVTTHTHSDTEYNALKDDRDTYYDIAKLNYYQIFVDRETVYHAIGYYYHWTYEIYYASCLTVTVHTSSVANTYIRVLYSAYGVNFDQTVYVAGAGHATFPLLPCDNLDVRVGNTLDSAATYTVSIVLYY